MAAQNIEEFFKFITDGKIAAVDLTLDEHPEWVNAPAVNGRSPIGTAIQVSILPMVKLLVKKGARVSPAHLDSAETRTEELEGTDQEDSALRIYTFLENHVNPEGDGDEEGEEREEIRHEREEVEAELSTEDRVALRELSTVMADQDIEAAKKILEAHPALLNVYLTPYDLTLTEAVRIQDYNFVKWMVDKGAKREFETVEVAMEIVEDLEEGGDTPAAVSNAKMILNFVTEPFVERLRQQQMGESPAGVSRALNFGDEPAAVDVKLETAAVEYTEMPTAYDMLEMEDVPLFDLITTGEKIIFKVKDIYFSTDLVPVQAALKDKSSTFYECKEELDGAPYNQDVNMDTPYFRVQLNGNFTIPEKELQAAVNSKYSIFEFVPSDKKLAFVASYASVQVKPGEDGLGRPVNIVSSDHCQKGSQQVTYTLKAVTMTKKKTGGKRKTYRAGKKSNKRKTYRK